MKKIVVRVIPLAFIVAVAFVVWVFFQQNVHRSSDLSLDLWLGAWHLANPMPVPTLLSIAFAAGFLVAAVPLGLRVMRQGRRLKSVEYAADPGDEPWP